MAKHESPGYRALLLAAQDFVGKVDRGEARSTDSYAKFKHALDIVKAEQKDAAVPANLTKLRAMLEKLPDGTLGSVQALEPPYQRDLIPYALEGLETALRAMQRAKPPTIIDEE